MPRQRSRAGMSRSPSRSPSPPAARVPQRNPPARAPRSPSRPAARAPQRNPPQQATSAPPPAPKQRAPATRGLGSASAEGMAFRSGYAIGQSVVLAMMHPRTIRNKTVASSVPSAAPIPTNSDVCDGQSKVFIECLNNNATDISKCQFYMDMFCECRRNSPIASGLTGLGLTD